METEHFILYSYLPRGEIQNLSDSLVSLHRVAEALVPGETRKYAPLQIVAFNSVSHFVNEFRKERFIGFMQPSLRQHLLVFTVEGRSPNPYEVAFHEYTHYLMRSRAEQYVPLWYEEGYAQYLSTIRFRKNSVTVGKIPSRKMRRLIKKDPTRWVNIVNDKPVLDWNSHEYADHYEYSWAITHFLNRGKTADGVPVADHVPTILDRISQGERASEVIAETTGYALEVFAEAMLTHFSNRRGLEYEISTSAFEENGDQTRDCLDYIEVRQMLGEVLIKTNPRRALSLVDQALARKPNNPTLRVIRSRALLNSATASLKEARQALELDPNSADANIRLAELYALNCLLEPTQACRAQVELATRHYLQALEVEPERVDASFGLGLVYLSMGRAGDGLNYLRVAYERAPWSPRINLYLGDAYRQIGNDAAALKHIERAVRWEPDDNWRTHASKILDSLEL